MCTIDIIILVCFIPAAISGLVKGFVSEALSLISLIAGAWMAFRFSELLCQKLSQYVSVIPEKVLQVISFVIIVIVVILLLALLAKALNKIIKIALLGWLDKLLGLSLGIAKAALIMSIAIVLFSSLNNLFGYVSQDTLSESVLYAPLKDIAYKVFPYLKALILKQ